MAGDGSSYAALGLEPGADPAAIERAYKRLIKLHHPDHEGGDANRAAEINRAYRELRGPAARDELVLHDSDVLASRPPFPRVGAALALAAVLLLLLVIAGPLGGWLQGVAAVTRPPTSRAMTAPDLMDQPLAAAAVDRAVGSAVRLSRTRDEMALASTSRDCHHRLRLDPSLAH